ncbi:tripartite tricarboxylate transporter substrate binding protein [Polaromonas sp.]|uniref:Bug family tripartite tricarboxylate transporter substrate binding protein n=1 Tax=Polaromonas sp. TaxID=1869339 RepID=UPI001794154E|nr:tripartite tricarboxylate transporter substrate binding protein [Polaromonas sp.]NMM06926.1 tripartite tricarboxylate transporter substrate binding protein [Polaromonas sp.]
MKKILASFLLCLIAGWAAAQGAYPNRAVRVIVPFPAGQTTDVVARLLSQQFTESLGQSFYVDNKAGAGAIIGTEQAKNAVPDGYTLLMASSGPLAINPSLYSKLPYDTLKDFQPIGMIVVVPQFLVVNKDFPANNLKELIAYVKQNPGKVNFGSGGSGLTNHLTMELLKASTGIQITHVPYKGAAAALTALIGGEISMMFESGPAVIPHVKSGKLKVFAVGSQRRSLALPDVLTVAEAGVPGFNAQSWAAFLAPAGTPKPVIQKLNAELHAALSKPAIRERLLGMGAEPLEYTPEQTAAYFRGELENWAVAVKASGARAD